MSNVLSEEKRQQVIALGRLGWPLRRIQQETGIRRETAGAYLKAAGVAVRSPGGWGRREPAKPANEVSPDPEGLPATPDSKPADEVSPESVPVPAPGRSPSASACEPYFDFIDLSLSKGRNAKAIYQDLVDDHGFTGRYQSVKRFVRRLRGQPVLQACPVIVTPPGEEAQVDYGAGPMVRDPHTGRYRRTRLFVLTLGYSRKAIRLTPRWPVLRLARPVRRQGRGTPHWPVLPARAVPNLRVNARRLRRPSSKPPPFPVGCRFLVGCAATANPAAPAR